MKIKMKFYINDNYLDIVADKKYKLIEWGLGSVRYTEAIDEVITAINDIQNTDKTWEMGYNATHINIKKHRVRIVDATDYNFDKHLDASEDYNIKFTKVSGDFIRYVDIESNVFKKMLLEWRRFVEKTDNMSFSQRKSYRKLVEFDLNA